MIDTRALTGESLPKKIVPEKTLLSGCINQNGVLKVRVTKDYQESTVNKILELVENASHRKSKPEKFITKFSRIYTPVVVIVALFLAITPPLIVEGAQFSDWIYRALSFLVVSCPCALVISIPLSFFGGIGGASKKGILIKGSNYLEQLVNTEIAVFDKTGTLTEGAFEVQKVEAINISDEELIDIVAHSEFYSNHPIANSIKKEYGKEVNERRISDIKEISGCGISAKIDGINVLVGNEKLMNLNSIEFSKVSDVGTILYIAINGEFKGYILISDKIKEDSKKLIKELHNMGIQKTVMLTGDKKILGEDVANKIGIKEAYTELLPEDKVKKVEELSNNKKGKLFFVGDGINDSPVLAIADIGIAMGAIGSDSAIEAADIVIMDDEPSKIITAINIAKKTMRIAKENIIFSITVKILILILTAMGLTNMWWAVFADVGVSIIAIMNSLRMIM